MKTFLSFLLGVLVIGGTIHHVNAQSTAWTYQGSLSDDNGPASGLFDMAFGLYPTATGGSAVATVTNSNVEVVDGEFTTMVDFGAAVFDGSDYWLELAVQPEGASGFLTLSPRQPVNPVPYAIHSMKAMDLVNPLFLGTTTDTPLEFQVNNERGLRLESSFQGVTVLAGYRGNHIGSSSGGSVIGGGGRAGWVNFIGDDSSHAMIGGGRGNTIGNSSDEAVISGGVDNLIGNFSGRSVIGGGLGNAISRNDATLNTPNATIAGGDRNVIAEDADYAVIGGGRFNTIGAGSFDAVIPGGRLNQVGPSARNAFAAGYRAVANHEGSFVWADSQNADFTTTDEDQFLIRASGGVGIGTTSPASALEVNGTFKANAVDTGSLDATGTVSANRLDAPRLDVESVHLPDRFGQKLTLYNSDFGIGVQAFTTYFRSEGRFAWFDEGVHEDGAYNPGAGGTVLMTLDSSGLRVRGTFVSSSDRNGKERFESIEPMEILDKVVALPLATWQYRQDPQIRHLGPTAQDFHETFGLGPDDRHIAMVDADGVALAAIQGLNQKLEEKDRRIDELTHTVQNLLQRVAALEGQD